MMKTTKLFSERWSRPVRLVVKQPRTKQCKQRRQVTLTRPSLIAIILKERIKIKPKIVSLKQRKVCSPGLTPDSYQSLVITSSRLVILLSKKDLAQR